MDLQKFAESLLEPEQDERLEILKYFTARVGGTANRRQEIYFRALRHSCPKIEIIEGYYLKTKTEMVPVDPRLGNKIEVWKHEEKGSDVNLAIHMVDDAWRNKYDLALIVTNDGDLHGAVQLVRHRYNDMRIRVGVVPSLGGDRKISRVLKKVSDFRRNISREVSLEPAQLPDHIPGKELRKPNKWIGEGEGR